MIENEEYTLDEQKETGTPVELSIVQFIDREIDHERQRIEAVFAERIANAEKARELAIRETERRLNDLNHAYEAAERDRRTLLPVAVHEAFYAEYKAWRDEVNKALAIQAGRAAAFAAAITVAFAVVQILVHYWR
jgi:hypothetical protein